jgi:YVTN family beta-propeller protein
MAIDPPSGNVYVANYDAGNVTVINGTQVLATLTVGWYPYGIGVNPTNGWVDGSNINDGTVSALSYR